MSYNETSGKKEFIERGNKRVNIAGNLTFFGTRLHDPVVQYGLLAKDWGKPFIERLRGSTLPQGPPLITNSSLDRLGLSPYRSIMFAMSVGSVVKQNYWLMAIGQEEMSARSGAMVGVLHGIGNTINTLLFVCTQTSASVNGEHFPQTPLIVGSSMYVAGILIELLSEQQRYMYKRDAANKGKVYTGGLFSLARHINYFGYTLWRAGFALAAGGWTWGAIVGGLSTWGFLRNIIPYHEHYMDEKVGEVLTPSFDALLTGTLVQYGEQYDDYRRSVPYMYVPLIC